MTKHPPPMGIKRILVPSDRGGTSETAVQYAAALARALGSELHMLHVARPTSPHLRRGDRSTPNAEPDERAVNEWLQRLASEIGPLETRTVVRYGRVAEQILDYAAQGHPDLIVVGTHGRTPPFLGSVAREVQATASCGVVAIAAGSGARRASPDAPLGRRGGPALRSILVPTDFSRHSRFALALGCAFARSSGGSVHLLHVLDSPRELAYVPPVAEPEDARLLRLHRRLDIEIAPHEDQGVVVRPVVRRGDPATGILGAAQEYGADLIIMGTHGRAAWEQFVLGSATQKVLRLANCPVATVFAPHTARAEDVRYRAVTGDADCPPLTT